MNNNNDIIPPPPPGRGEWDDWDSSEAYLEDDDGNVLDMMNNDLIKNLKDDVIKIVKTASNGEYKENENFNDDDYDDRIDINIVKGAGAFSPNGNNDMTFSNIEGRGPMDDWGSSYSEESPYFDEDDIIEDWSDRKSTVFFSSSSSDWAKPDIDSLIKNSTNNEIKIPNNKDDIPLSASALPSSSSTSSLDISILTISNEMNRRLNEIEMKSIIQHQDLKLFYVSVSAIQLIIILLLMKL